jgi:hypothetical protein
MRLLAMLVLLSLPSGALAQTPALRKGIRVEAGLGDNHSGHDRYLGGAFRAFGVIDNQDLVSIEGGVLAGMPFLGGDGGMQIRFPVRPRVSALVRAGAGVTFEDGYVGPFWRYGGGIELHLDRDRANRLAITYQRGGHDAADIGPHLLMVGLEHRFGRR